MQARKFEATGSKRKDIPRSAKTQDEPNAEHPHDWTVRSVALVERATACTSLECVLTRANCESLTNQNCDTCDSAYSRTHSRCLVWNVEPATD